MKEIFLDFIEVSASMAIVIAVGAVLALAVLITMYLLGRKWMMEKEF